LDLFIFTKKDIKVVEQTTAESSIFHVNLIFWAVLRSSGSQKNPSILTVEQLSLKFTLKMSCNKIGRRKSILKNSSAAQISPVKFSLRPGVNVMIIIFGDLGHCSAKVGNVLEKQC
jgi:hypothetical protein